MKQFFPNIEYNRKKRKSYLGLLILSVFLIGGLAASFFLMNQSALGLIILLLLVVVFSSIPSALANYPVKNTPIIEINNGKAKLYGKEEIKISDILAITVCIDVPKVGLTKAEQEAFLKETASKKPEEPVLGSCDILVKDAKGKEVTKYHIIDDAIGALQAFLDAGVKKYRIVYCLKRKNEIATYRLYAQNKSENDTLSGLSEKDRMMQLL